MVTVFTSGTTTSNGGAGGAYTKTRIPALVKTGSTLVAFCEGRRVDADFGDLDIICSRSTNGGTTWTGTDCILVTSNGTNTAGNPAPVVNSAGDIVLLYITQVADPPGAGGRVLKKKVSTDTGSTWGSETDLSSVQDAAWTWCATGPCHGIRITTGRYIGRLVVPFNANISTTYITGIFYSDNDGSTWSRYDGYSSSSGVYNVNEASVAELNDGRLALFNRNQAGSGGEKSVMYSSDGGATWTTPVDTNIESAGAVQGSVLKHEGTPNKALFYATPENLSGSNRLDLRIERSLNNGTTWHQEEYIHANAAYSDMAQTGSDSIGILYENGVSPQYQFITFEDIPLSVIHQVGVATTSDTNGTDATSITITKPTGVESGHLLLAAIASNSADCTPPTGFTQIEDAGTTIRSQLYWKIADGSEPANYTFSFTGARPILGTMTAWSGTHQTAPIAGVATATVDAVDISEPATTPSVTNNTAQRGRMMYIRSAYDSNSTADTTFTVTDPEVFEVADFGVQTASTNRAHGWYVGNAEFTNNGTTKTGLAITASKTEEANVRQTFVVETVGDIFAYDVGEVSESESIIGTTEHSDSGEVTESELITIPATETDSGTVTESEGLVMVTEHLIADNFDRADGPLTVSSSGHDWTSADSGVLGVVNGQCKKTG